MGKTNIEWTDDVWNPIAGCTIVSKGCTNCYAMHMAARLAARGQPKYAGLTKVVNGHPVWTGKIAVAGEPGFSQPLRWTKPRRIFVNSMSDLFHEDVPVDVIDRVFAIMALAPQHTYQVLTKRPERMRDYLANPDLEDRLTDLWRGDNSDRATWNILLPLRNVWLGVSVEDQATADERIPLLLETPAAVRWISAEPLLGPIRLDSLEDCDNHRNLDALRGKEIGGYRAETDRLDWVVVGGESGTGARPMHPDWARLLRDQCAQAGVPFFFKQWGEWKTFDPVHPKPGEWVAERVGKKAAGATLDGVEHREYPR